ncbi:MAG TPA: transcriptional repressor [Ignavibacteriaceae bacterium]|nr:transcriptional repressor [Ignavibacteriaceae bacterium]
MKNEQATQIFKDFLKRGKNRITPERFEVLDAAIEHEGHFGADDLYIKMKNSKSAVSRATVYNTLELLAQCELISKRNFGDNMTRFESNFKKQTHDHLICVDCGRIIEFTDSRIKKIPKDISDSFDFEYLSYSFNIFGRCKNKKDCLNRK